MIVSLSSDAVAGVQPAWIALEPQPEGEEVGERDQSTVHEELGQRVPVNGYGRGDGSAGACGGYSSAASTKPG